MKLIERFRKLQNNFYTKNTPEDKREGKTLISVEVAREFRLLGVHIAAIEDMYELPDIKLGNYTLIYPKTLHKLNNVIYLRYE